MVPFSLDVAGRTVQVSLACLFIRGPSGSVLHAAVVQKASGWIGYTELDSFERVARSRRGPWPTRSTSGISPTSSSGR